MITYTQWKTENKESLKELKAAYESDTGNKITLEAFSHQMYADTSHGHEDLHKKRRKYLEDMFAIHRTKTKDETKTGSQCGNARPISLLALKGLQCADSWLPALKAL